MSRILVVEDDIQARLPIEELLIGLGYQVFCAADGREGVALFQQVVPDLVLMDIDMPVMDGFEATRRIKATLAPGHLVPVVFLTGEERDGELARCLACGGDDFINKPLRPIILRSRIEAWLARAAAARREARDRRSIEAVLAAMRQNERFDPTGLRMLTTPVESTNGDVVLSARTPAGLHHLLLGDFTGHGLAAAIGGPLVAGAFYAMTAKGLPPEEIMRECGYKAFEQLPVNMFLAFCFVELNRAAGRMRVWNGGLPRPLLYRTALKAQELPTHGMPLGIVRDPPDFSTITDIAVERGERLYLFTDGIIEAMNGAGEMFDQGRLEEAITAMLLAEGPLESIERRVRDHCAGRRPRDDLTLVELSC